MRMRLRVTRGPGTDAAAEVLPDKPLVVGRGTQTDFQILDEGLSRTHCRFYWEDGRPHVEDLGSRNGTVVNGDRIPRRALADGDVVTLGAVDLTVSVEGAAPPPLPKAKPVSEVQIVDAGASTIGVRKRVQVEQTLLFGGAPQAKDLIRLQRDLATIYKVVNLFSSENDTERLFGCVMDTIMAVTGADRGAVFLRPEDGGPLRPVGFRQRGKPLLSSGPSGEVKVSRTIVEEGLKGLSLITSDALADERFRAGASIVMQNIHAAMCVPLESHDKILGVIYVDTTGGHRRFAENDLELLTVIGKQAGIAVQRALYLQETRELFYSTVLTLAASIEAKDRYTRGHSERVTDFSVAIAEQLGLDAKTVGTVRLSGLLHDVGKIGVPEAVLNKAGKLSNEEYAVIQEHPSAGARILGNIPRIGEVLLGVKHHHEKWNGKGYPDRLAGEAIPEIARIIAVADAFDAMSSHRAYRKGLSEDVIFAEIRKNAGVQFDPKCVEAFFAAVASGRIPKPSEVQGQQAAYADRLQPPEASDAQGVQPPPDAA